MSHFYLTALYREIGPGLGADIRGSDTENESAKLDLNTKQRVAKRVLKGDHSARVPKAEPEEPLFQWAGQRGRSPVPVDVLGQLRSAVHEILCRPRNS